jgi:hypothetical protein
MRSPLWFTIERREMLKSWVKVFLAAVATLASTGQYDLKPLLIAGLCAVLPVIYNYFDPNDPRYGKFAVGEDA